MLNNLNLLEKIILPEYRGTCAGVDYALEGINDLLKSGKKISLNHEIVHNKFVMESLSKNNVEVIENLEDVPDDSLYIISAHGGKKDLKNSKNLEIHDLTCHLVTKVHREAQKYYNLGYEIVLVGHGNHPEIKATMSYATMFLVENPEDVDHLNLDVKKKKVCLSQTTLSLYDKKDIIDKLIEKYPEIEIQDDVCFATENRQKALEKIILQEKPELVLVIGSRNSSNSVRLKEIALKYIYNTHQIDNYQGIKLSWFKDVRNAVVTSGASVPNLLEDQVLIYLYINFGSFKIINKIRKDEKIHFSPYKF